MIGACVDGLPKSLSFLSLITQSNLSFMSAHRPSGGRGQVSGTERHLQQPGLQILRDHHVAAVHRSGARAAQPGLLPRRRLEHGQNHGPASSKQKQNIKAGVEIGGPGDGRGLSINPRECM